jgi:UDP-N-acetyl-D-mannosaminuronate dehydrogenase
LCENLNKLGYTVDVLDPLVLNLTKKKYFNFLKSLHKKIKYHGILLAVPHKKILDKIDFYSNSIVKNGILLDLKGLLKKEDIKADLINF